MSMASAGICSSSFMKERLFSERVRHLSTPLHNACAFKAIDRQTRTWATQSTALIHKYQIEEAKAFDWQPEKVMWLREFCGLAGQPTNASKMRVSHAVASSSSSTFCCHSHPMAVMSFNAELLKMDPRALATSLSSSVTFLCACAYSGLMQKSGLLPLETASLLSQISFRILIPCFLMSKVSKTLSSNISTSLVILPFFSIFQVLLGAFLGKFLYQTFCANKKMSLALPASHHIQPKQNNAKMDIHSYSEVPLSRTSIEKQESLVIAACAFGNCVSLPLVLLSGALPPEEMIRAAGYLSLYIVGWSPALWILGYKIINHDKNEPIVVANKWSLATLYALCNHILNPPLLGVLLGILIGATPLSHLFFLRQSFVNTETANFAGGWSGLCSRTQGIFSPIYDAASLLGSGTVAIQTVVLACSLAVSLPSASTKLLSSSQLEPDIDSEISPSDSQSNSTMKKSFFWVVFVVRIIIMPCTSIYILDWMQKFNLLPLDPVCRLTMMVLAAMPTSQNLIVLCQLHASTRPLARSFSNLILSQYLVALLPLTLWMAVFLYITHLGI